MTLEEFYHTEKILLDQFFVLYEKVKVDLPQLDWDSFDIFHWEKLFQHFVTITTMPQLDSTYLKQVKIKDETTQP